MTALKLSSNSNSPTKTSEIRIIKDLFEVFILENDDLSSEIVVLSSKWGSISENDGFILENNGSILEKVGSILENDGSILENADSIDVSTINEFYRHLAQDRKCDES